MTRGSISGANKAAQRARRRANRERHFIPLSLRQLPDDSGASGDWLAPMPKRRDSAALGHAFVGIVLVVKAAGDSIQFSFRFF